MIFGKEWNCFKELFTAAGANMTSFTNAENDGGITDRDMFDPLDSVAMYF